MPRISPGSSKQERKYIEIIKQHPHVALIAIDNAPREGFEYFASDDYRMKFGRKGNLVTDKFRSLPVSEIPRFFNIFLKNVYGIFTARRRSYADVSEYLDKVEKSVPFDKRTEARLKGYPNTSLWNELSEYARNNWGVLLGFTAVPEEIIFKGKAILFRYALVAIQEMAKEKIDTAPKLDAGEEVLAVYNSLGVAVNDIARWLRKYHGVRCQANHPLGGLVNTVPLAVKAGMGWSGCNGLLITPEFGQRQRIAPIFVEKPIFEFTDSDKHRWIGDYCKSCRRCQKACPTGAILEDKKYHPAQIPGVGQVETSIEREKCYPYFNETLGCSICIKVCPFSRGNGTYERLKKIVLKNQKEE
jgi:ferredoxin